MVCIGAGPGPKNVLVEFSDGSRLCVPYAIWKHKLSKQQGGSLSDTQYVTVDGLIQQFGDKAAVTSRDINGQTVREFTIKANGSQKLVRITLWPEFDSVEVNAGDFVCVDGKYNVSEKDGRTFYNLTANKLAVVPGVQKAAREVVNQQGQQGSSGGNSGGGSPF